MKELLLIQLNEWALLACDSLAPKIEAARARAIERIGEYGYKRRAKAGDRWAQAHLAVLSVVRSTCSNTASIDAN